MNLETWKQHARRLSAQTYALYLAYRHPRTPWYAKVFAALIVGYVFSPIDPIPDFIPGVGLLDELVVVPIGVLLAAKMIPPDVLEECREKAREPRCGCGDRRRLGAVRGAGRLLGAARLLKSASADPPRPRVRLDRSYETSLRTPS
jgi:uncharacterized membrane protein YkvA (DUF1232 family)